MTTHNGEVTAFADHWPANFTKGLPHDQYGRVDIRSFVLFLEALDADAQVAVGAGGQPVLAGPARFAVPLGPEGIAPADGGYRPDDAFGSPIVTTGVTGFSTVIMGTAPGATQAPKIRTWESPRAGHVYDLQGPDAGALALFRAPRFGSPELIAEIAELYAMALLRDVPFYRIADGSGQVTDFDPQGQAAALTGVTVAGILGALNALQWFNRTTAIPGLHPVEERRRAARFSPGGTALTAHDLFRGSLPGVKVGPYISQFLLIGNAARPSKSDPTAAAAAAAVGAPSPDAGQVRNLGSIQPPFGVPLPDVALRDAAVTATSEAGDFADLPVVEVGDAQAAPACDEPGVRQGYILYGAQRIDQRVAAELPGRDHMADWRLWLDVQNGADLRGNDAFVPPTDAGAAAAASPTTPKSPRFVGTPRDLGTFVHVDQLYQAYLNASLLLIANEVDFDAGLPSGAFHSTRGSFATFGGPHLLSLLTEVAARVLKVVRRQKFNHHLRLRPEALGGVLTLAHDGKLAELGLAATHAQATASAIGATSLLGWIDTHNQTQNTRRESDGYFPRLADETAAPVGYHPSTGKNILLPMQFPEGSPMHPAYGAGHASVAGACTTIAKAFFELYRLPANAKDLLDPLGLTYAPPDFTQAMWWDPLTMADLPAPRKMAPEVEKIKCVYRAPDGTASQALLEPATAPTSGGPFTGYIPQELTLVGEFNKLAANIAIGRNMAGVHYYTDYYNSVRMGERLAVGILQDQMLQYPEPVTMRFESFDGDRVIISTDGGTDVTTPGSPTAQVRVFEPDGSGAFNPIAFETWWDRDI